MYLVLAEESRASGERIEPMRLDTEGSTTGPYSIISQGVVVSSHSIGFVVVEAQLVLPSYKIFIACPLQPYTQLLTGTL